MATRNLAKDALASEEDWYGNNAAMPCPVCRQIFIVSGFLNQGQRECPRCQKSKAEMTNAQVKIEWPDELLGSGALLTTMQAGLSKAGSVQRPLTRSKICVFGTHHAYQYKSVRRRYFQNVHDLIQIHAVDLVAEEFSAPGQDSYAEKIAAIHQVQWKNVDLTSDERKLVPDLNPHSIGTQIDLDLHVAEAVAAVC